MAKHTTDDGTIEITASDARESDCMPDKPEARDVDVEITIGELELSGEVTLLPSDYDGSYGSWGDAAHWVSSPLLQELYRLDGAGEIELRDVLSSLSATAAAAVAS